MCFSCGKTQQLDILLPLSVQISCDVLMHHTESLPEITVLYCPLLSLEQRKGCENRGKTSTLALSLHWRLKPF